MKTFRDVYTLPLKLGSGGWIYDQNNYFVADTILKSQSHRQQLVDIINGNLIAKFNIRFAHKEGLVFSNAGENILRIRGWGNLTGTGGFNLSNEEAANIQDTFAEYIVEQLNKCYNDKN